MEVCPWWQKRHSLECSILRQAENIGKGCLLGSSAGRTTSSAIATRASRARPPCPLPVYPSAFRITLVRETTTRLTRAACCSSRKPSSKCTASAASSASCAICAHDPKHQDLVRLQTLTLPPVCDSTESLAQPQGHNAPPPGQSLPGQQEPTAIDMHMCMQPFGCVAARTTLHTPPTRPNRTFAFANHPELPAVLSFLTVDAKNRSLSFSGDPIVSQAPGPSPKAMEP
jgi:hypothetical protein